MRKILISVLLVLMIILAYFTIFQGISIGTFEILSTQGIVELNDELTNKIEEANRKIKSDLQSQKSNLSSEIDTLLQNKEEYYNLANVSTESEISAANTEEIYNIEYLWLRVGRHARTEGVNIRMDVLNGSSTDSNMKDLSFTIEGQYEGIIEFVSALEEDSELSFRIEDFNLQPLGSNLQATFDVKDIRINIENTTGSVTDSTTTDTNTVDNTDTQANQTNVTDTNTVS